MTNKCEFCNGTGVEPGEKNCVWCDNTGRTLTAEDFLSPERANGPCQGMNCGISPGSGQPHSRECLAQHAAAIAGGTFFKHEACSDNTRKRRERWVSNIRAALAAGVPGTVRHNLEYTVQEIERSIRYGGTQSLRAEMARLLAALGASQHTRYEFRRAGQTNWVPLQDAELETAKRAGFEVRDRGAPQPTVGADRPIHRYSLDDVDGLVDDENGALVHYSDYSAHVKALQALATGAAPQPPVGGDVEVLGYRAQRIEPVKYERLNRPLLTTVSDWGPAFVVTELVDRQLVTARDQQITALQARIAELAVMERFVGYLLDNCEREVIYEESLQHWLADMLRKEKEAGLAQQVTK